MATKKTRPPGDGTHAERIRRERGAGKPLPPAVASERDEFHFGDDFLSPKEMHEWAHFELREIAKATELRTREILDLTARYSAGEIAAEQANELQSRYYHRWGKAIPNATLGHSLDKPIPSDEEIIASMDKLNRKPFVTPRQEYENYRAFLSVTEKDPGAKLR